MTTAVSQRILITGAGGNMGQLLRGRLAAPGRTLRLLDRTPVPLAGPGENVDPLEHVKRRPGNPPLAQGSH